MVTDLGLPAGRHLEELRMALAIADDLVRDARRELVAKRCRRALTMLRAAAVAVGSSEAHVESLPFGRRRRRLSALVQRRLDQIGLVERRVARTCLLDRGRS